MTTRAVRTAASAAVAVCLAAARVAAGQVPAPGPAGPDAGGIPASGADEHLWFVAPGVPTVLRHHAVDPWGAAQTRGLSLKEMPEAIAAWGDQVWVLFPPEGPAPGRLVFTVRVRRNPAFGGHSFDPPDRLRLLGALEGTGQVAGFVGSAEGPVALLVRVAGAATGEAPVPARLLRLAGSQWVRIELPRELSLDGEAALGSFGERGQGIAILTASPGAARGTLHLRGGDGRWSISHPELGLASPRLARTGGALVASGLDASLGRLRVGYLRAGGILPLSELAAPAAPFAVAGMRDGVRIIEWGTAGPTLRRIDPLTGRAGDPQVAAPMRMPRGPAIQMLVLVACGVTAALAVFLLRTGSRAPVVRLPAGTVALGPLARMAALAIDLAAGGLAALLLLDSPPASLLRLPWWAPPGTDPVPVLTMIAITVAHSTAGELLCGRSAGKALVGARITACDGSRASAAAILVRNAAKALVLFIPVLALLALVSPHWQGLGDLLAKTVVVRRAGAAGGDR